MVAYAKGIEKDWIIIMYNSYLAKRSTNIGVCLVQFKKREKQKSGLSKFITNSRKRKRKKVEGR
jgi:hypothetical protein